jgi:hypothetical protein
MDTTLLQDKFARLGARLKFASARNRFAVDIEHDARGEYFEITTRPTEPVRIEVLDVRPRDRHLLLLSRDGSAKSKFLCGHDERHWFVAGIPESAPVGTVPQAMEALKPREVLSAQTGLPSRMRNRRKNPAFVRQGEWFFLPAPHVQLAKAIIFRDEPLSRGAGSKPHRVEFCARTGGEQVLVCRQYPGGLSPKAHARLLERRPEARHWGWMTRRRNAQVYVRGRVRHPDHATITLATWHRVVMNTENQSQAMRFVTFLD